MEIPIQNIYYLLCYAWNRLDEGDLVDVSGIESNSLPNLFARVLISGFHRLAKSGLDRGYVEREDLVVGIKGKIRFAESLKRNLFLKGQACCLFDELDHNILQNQILKATVIRLCKATTLERELRERLMVVADRLSDVDEIRLNRFVFQRVQLHRNNSFYSFLLSICRLVYESLLVDETSGEWRFRDFVRDEGRMWKVFQDFVFNFFKLEQSLFQVSSQVVYWDAKAVGDTAESLIPRMETDITLRSPRRIKIIDTKYYPEMLVTRYVSEKLRSEHLYQLFAYLKNFKSPELQPQQIEGILVYPTVNRTLDLRFIVQGHPVRILSLNLAQPWELIKRNLLTVAHGS